MKEPFTAEVAELADALASGASPRKGVQVQVLSSASSIILRTYDRFQPGDLESFVFSPNCPWGNFGETFSLALR